MRKRFPLVLFGFGFLLCLLTAQSLAEDKTPPLSESVSFEQIPDLLEKPDAKVKAGIDGLIAAVDAEVKADRLTPVFSEKLRAEANRADFPSNIDGKEI
jgi:hypothetical protein